MVGLKADTKVIITSDISNFKTKNSFTEYQTFSDLNIRHQSSSRKTPTYHNPRHPALQGKKLLASCFDCYGRQWIANTMS